MDLSYAEKYERLRAEVRAFLEAQHPQSPRGPAAVGVAAAGLDALRAWQQLLIEQGYAGRTIPREYGGYGAPPDPLEPIILDEEFSRARLPRGLSG